MKYDMKEPKEKLQGRGVEELDQPTRSCTSAHFTRLTKKGLLALKLCSVNDAARLFFVGVFFLFVDKIQMINGSNISFVAFPQSLKMLTTSQRFHFGSDGNPLSSAAA